MPQVARQTIELTLNIGIACLHHKETALGELINQAARALYLAKSNRRNRMSLCKEKSMGKDSGCSEHDRKLHPES
jgi:PleD family two-component response regulator